MSVLANTLNAYAARLKAQRRAQEREAIQASRVKSQAQRAAEQAQRQAIRAQREQQQKTTASELAADILDRVVSEFKRRYGQEFATGERGRAVQDIKRISELYFYRGPITTNTYKVYDFSCYSKPAFCMITSVLANLKIIDQSIALQAQIYNCRQLVVYKTPTMSSCGLGGQGLTVDELKAGVKNEIARSEKQQAVA
jgi:multidrug efflux pump subunit AcrA (membrane-fusion protein)